RGVPHARAYDAPAAPDPLPDPPDAWAENPPGLLAALDRACQTAANEPTRYALHRLQLRGGTGEVLASDAHQLLAEGGFRFPWDGDVLVARTAAFAARELPHDQNVRVDRTDGHVWVRAGAWTFALAVDAVGRYPDAAAVIPR